MGKHKSPFTDWIAEEWDQLVLDKGARLPKDELRRRWRALYDKTTRDGGWIVPLEDAQLVGSLGWYLAVEDKDFVRARELARSVLGHPEMKPEHWKYRDFVVDEAVADILCGNVSEGCLRLRGHLRQSPAIRHYVRNHVVRLLEAEMDSSAQADPSIRELVVEIMNAYPNKKRAAKWATEAATYGDLVQVIYGAFGWQRLSKPHIREARPGDLRPLAEFHYSVWRETYEGILDERELNGPTVQLRETQWQAFFDRNDPREFCFVLENEDGELVRFAKGIPSDHPEFDGELSKLYVARAYRGYGLGGVLLAHVARRMLDLGMRSMVVFAEGRNPVVKMYEHLGAEKLDEDPNLGHYGWRDIAPLADTALASVRAGL